MNAEAPPTIQQALDLIEHLPMEDQITVIEVLQRRMVEQRRSEIARNAQTTLRSVRDGQARYGSVEDLKADLES